MAPVFVVLLLALGPARTLFVLLQTALVLIPSSETTTLLVESKSTPAPTPARRHYELLEANGLALFPPTINGPLKDIAKSNSDRALQSQCALLVGMKKNWKRSTIATWTTECLPLRILISGASAGLTL